MSKLREIFAHKREEIASEKMQVSLVEMQAQAALTPPPRDFVAALRQARSRPALIAEIKRRSPSRGLLVADFDPLRLAQVYADNGAAAISVLTDEKYFGGALEHLWAVSRVGRDATDENGWLPSTNPSRIHEYDGETFVYSRPHSWMAQTAPTMPHLPLLRKDFICDPYQIYQARAAGADAILLIAAELSQADLVELHALALSLGLAALVEVHDESELEAALACGARLIGINNRNLHDFTVSLATAERLGRRVPVDICLVAESGIHTAADVARLRGIPRPGGAPGVDAILVGEALVTAADVGAKVRELSCAPQRPEDTRGHEDAS